MRNHMKKLAILLCIVTVVSLFATTASALGAVSGQSTVKSENIYVNGVDTGATHTQITLPSGSSYNPFSSASVVNVVEVSPATSGLQFTALNCGTYNYSTSTIGKAAISYNNSHDGTIIAAINADPWYLYNRGYNGDKTTTTATRHQSITRGLLIIDGEIYQTNQASQEVWLNTSSEWGYTTLEQRYVFAQNADGTFMIGIPDIKVTVTNTTTGVFSSEAEGINRLPAPGAIMVYNHRIGSESMAYEDAYEIYLRVDSSAFSIGETVTGTVTGVYPSGTTNRPAIDANTIVISARGKANVPESYSLNGVTYQSNIQDKTLMVQDKFSIGDTVSISVATRKSGDAYDSTQKSKWNTVTTAVGGFYPQVVKGTVQTTDDGKTNAYPVPLIALKEDGTAMMITVTSKSDVRAGTQQQYLGEICKELGAYTAIMFDGGGSTSMITYEDGAYLRRAGYADGSVRSVVVALGLLYTGANVSVSNSETGLRQDIDGVANSSSILPDDGTTGGGGTTTPPDETDTPTETPTEQPVENPLPTPDITGSATTDFRYYANIDYVNETGPDGSSTPYQGILGFKNPNATPTSGYSTITSGVSADANGKVSVTGWAVVNGGQSGHYWSVDGTNWYECVDTVYNKNMSNWDDIWAAATAGASLTAAQSASEEMAKFATASADLTPWAGQTVTVYFAVGSKITPTSVAMMCKIENVAVPADAVHVHTPGAEATCTTAQTCTECGEEIAPALGHEEVSHEGKEATCTEGGYEAYVDCSRCDYTTYKATDALGHNEQSHDAKEATCTEGGHEAYVDCSRCDYTTYKATNALGHNEQSHPAKAATCAEAGHAAYVDCSRCDYTTYKAIPATGAHADNDNNLKCDTCGTSMACAHKGEIQTLEAVEPTCTATGLTEGKKCLTCNTTIQAQATVKALGHNEVSHEGKEATCTEGGYEAYVDCTRCDYTTYHATSKLGHEEVSHEGIPATCAEDGYKAYVDCTRCDYTTYEKIPATGEHTDVDDNLKCDRCDAPMDCTHDGLVEVLDAVVPTCTTTGLTEGTRCAICNVVLVKQETVNALGHEEISHEGKAATCTEGGYEAYVDCSRCDYTTYRETSALEHNIDIVAAKPATCTEDGHTVYMACVRCDYTTWTEDNVIPATGHAYDDDYDAACNICGEEREVSEIPTEPQPTESAPTEPTPTEPTPTESQPTEAPTEDGNTAEPENRGCNSAIGFGAIAIIATLALAGSVVIKKKED